MLAGPYTWDQQEVEDEHVETSDRDTPSEQAVSHIGFWATSTFLGGFARTSRDAAANAAGYTVASAPITAD